MKKRLLVFVMAAVVALALPVLAFADNSSPKADERVVTTTLPDGSSVKFDVTAEGATDLTVQETSELAAGAQEMINDNAGNIVAVKSFDVNSNNFTTGSKVTLVYTVDSKYAGLTCYVYVTHSDRSTERHILPVKADGTVDFTMTKLSTVTFVLTNEKYSDRTAVVADKAADSPKTGGIIL